MANKTPKNEQTSSRVASNAGKVLRDPNSTARERSIAGSALTQAGSKKK